jgi:hypothetical protein
MKWQIGPVFNIEGVAYGLNRSNYEGVNHAAIHVLLCCYLLIFGSESVLCKS